MRREKTISGNPVPMLEPLEPRLLLAYDYALTFFGPQDVVNGHDLYIWMYGDNITGEGDETVDLTAITPPGISVTFESGNFLYRLGHEQKAVKISVAPGVVANGLEVIIRGDSRNTDVVHDMIVPINALPTPADLPTPVFSSDLVPISQSDLDKWEKDMLVDGEKWGLPSSNDQQDVYDGIIERGMWEQSTWYYDGLANFNKIYDYQGSTGWLDSADACEEVFRNWVISVGGGAQGWRNFTHGLAIDYLETGDTVSRDALLLLYNNAAFNTGAVRTELEREIAFALNAAVSRAQIGEPLDSTALAKLNRLVDMNLGIFDQLFVMKKTDDTHYVQPFYMGLTSEALIRYYEFTVDSPLLPTDTRIPGAIRQAADWLMGQTYDPSTGQWLWNAWDEAAGAWYMTITYKTDSVDVLNFLGRKRDLPRVLPPLIYPMYGWLYHTLGESAGAMVGPNFQTYREWGDFVFHSTGFHDEYYTGKEFSQSFHWSTDYVQWRLDNDYALDHTAPVINSVKDVTSGSGSALVTWNTSEYADSQVEYGLDTNYGTVTELNDTLVRTHRVTVNGLTPGLTYHYRVRSVDGSGNVSYSHDQVMNPVADDTTGPTLTDVKVAALSTYNLTFSWSTDEYASGWLEWGANTSYGRRTSLETTDLAGHTKRYFFASSSEWMASGGIYHYRLHLIDADGNETVTPDMTFRTPGAADTTLPTVSITAPTGGTVLTTPTTLTANASDNYFVNKVQFKLGENLVAADFNSPWSVTLNPADYAPGIYQLTAVAWDSANNSQTSAPVTVEIPGGAPPLPPVVESVTVNGLASRSVSSIVPFTTGVNSIFVNFDQPVNFSSTDVEINKVSFPGGTETLGTTITPLSVTGSGTNTMTITLADATVIDTWVKVVLDDSITSLGGTNLDGDAPLGGSGRNYLYSSTLDLPSGDGAAGGQAVFFVGNCVADISGDGNINIFDAFVLNQAWGSQVGGPNYVPLADITADGSVNIFDAFQISQAWGHAIQSLPTSIPLSAPLMGQSYALLSTPLDDEPLTESSIQSTPVLDSDLVLADESLATPPLEPASSTELLNLTEAPPVSPITGTAHGHASSSLPTSEPVDLLTLEPIL